MQRIMEELVDPLVLEAAIALVDECYPAHERGGGPYALRTMSAESASFSGLRKRAQEELMWLRNSVRHLQDHAIASRVQHDAPTNGSSSRQDGIEDSGAGRRISGEREAQARWLLLELQAYRRVHDERRLVSGYRGRHVIRAVGDEQTLTTLRSRLDALSEIMQANSMSIGIPTPMAEFVPTITNTGFQYQARSCFFLPFKLSHVADVLWGLTIDAIYEGQMDCGFTPDEIATNMESTRETPWGMIASSGSNALRRVFEADGSVVFLHTMAHSGPYKRSSEVDCASPNLVAGCVIKYAGWTRIRRVPQSIGVRADRALVCVEVAQCLVVNSVPGHSISRDRVLRIRNSVLDPDNLRSGSLAELESRLVDRQRGARPQVA